MKKCLTLLFFAISLQVVAQTYPITGINISLPANPDANTINWGSGTSMLSITATTKAENGRVTPHVVESKLLVTIKKGGAKICGIYTGNSAPSSGFNTLTKVWSGTNAVALLGQDCVLTPGDYEICAQFFGYGAAGAASLSEEKCKPFTIRGNEQQTFHAPQGISPVDGAVITEKELQKPIVFRWIPVVPKPQDPVKYRLVVWQLMQGQTGAQAIKANQPILTKEVDNMTQVIINNLITGPCKPPYLCDFIWNVQALNREGKPIGENNGTSKNFALSVNSGGCQISYDVKIDTIKCLSVDSVEICAKFICNKSGYGPSTGYTPFASIITAISVLDQNNSAIIPPYSIGNPAISEGNSFTKCIRVKINSTITQLTVHFDTKLNDPAHLCINMADGQTKVPNCSCDPCKGKSAIFGKIGTTPTVNYQNNGTVSESSTVTFAPAKVIKVSAEIVDVERFGQSGCLSCTKESREFGNFVGGSLNSNAGSVVNGMNGYGKQIQWQFGIPTSINSFNYDLQMLFPPLSVVSCCTDSLRICTRWSFTDANCIICDTLICSVITRTYKTKVIKSMTAGPDNGILPTAVETARQIQKLGEPYKNWYDQESEELPKDFEAQSQKRYDNLIEKEAKFPEFLEAQKIYFYGIRELKTGSDQTNLLSSPTMCGNGDFESGQIDASEWSGAKATTNGSNTSYTPWVTGLSPANGLPVNASLTAGTNHQTIVTPGPDPNPVVGTLLNRVAPFPTVNNYAVRLGNSVNGWGVEKLEKSFVVPSANNILHFWYAAVFENGGHGNSGNPSFRVRVYNASNVLVPGLVYLNSPIVAQDAIIADVTNPFFIKANSSVVVRQWTCAKIDLSSLANQTVRVEFINTDCSQGGHYGYTYLDNICLGCEGSPSGNVTIQPISKPCIKLGTQVCVNYTLPSSGNITGSGKITLKFYQNGNSVPYTILSPNLTASGIYCFPVDPAGLPCTSGQVGYDVVATGNFAITVGGITTPIIVTSPDPVGNYQGIKPGFNNDLVCCGTPADNCCTSFVKQVTAQVSMVGNSTSGFNNIKFVTTLKAGPRPIKQVRISVVNFESTSSNKECLTCESNAGRYGTISVPQGLSGGGKDPIEGMVYPTKPILPLCFPVPCPAWNALPTSEVTWGNENGPGYNLMDGVGDQTTTFTVSLPKQSTLSCCDDTLKICIKYSFMDVDCITCDTIICYKVVNRKTVFIIAQSLQPLLPGNSFPIKYPFPGNIAWDNNNLFINKSGSKELKRGEACQSGLPFNHI